MNNSIHSCSVNRINIAQYTNIRDKICFGNIKKILTF